jgi:hypothetical protein
MYLTNMLDAIFDPYNQISDGSNPSGVRLINEGNGIEHSLSYRGWINDDFLRIYAEEDFVEYPDPYSLQLGGSGTNYADFSWRTNNMTPGAINVDQYFPSGPGPEPETNAMVEIRTISCAATQVTITAAFTNAAGWTPDALYVTNLLTKPRPWVLITPRWVTTNLYAPDAGLWSIRFAYPIGGGSNCFFRVKAANSPPE